MTSAPFFFASDKDNFLSDEDLFNYAIECKNCSGSIEILHQQNYFY